jgi:hypothetical protein
VVPDAWQVCRTSRVEAILPFRQDRSYRERYHREKKARRLALRPNILGKIEIFHGTDDIGNGRNGKDSIDNQVEGRKEGALHPSVAKLG